jgi:hypothetical protein
MQFYINIIDLLFVMDYSKKLLEIFNTEIIDIFKNTINKYCKNKRTPKYTTEYYLYNIIIFKKIIKISEKLEKNLMNYMIRKNF